MWFLFFQGPNSFEALAVGPMITVSARSCFPRLIFNHRQTSRACTIQQLLAVKICVPSAIHNCTVQYLHNGKRSFTSGAHTGTGTWMGRGRSRCILPCWHTHLTTARRCPDSPGPPRGLVWHSHHLRATRPWVDLCQGCTAARLHWPRGGARGPCLHGEKLLGPLPGQPHALLSAAQVVRYPC